MVACFPEIRRTEVIFMEDDSLIQSKVKNILEEELNCNVIVIEEQQKAIDLANQKESRFFIFDVHMGRGREQEGLDALEEIKIINSNIPVFILSAYEQYERFAKNLNANGFIHKEADLQQVIRSKIEPEILKYELKVLEARRKETLDQLHQIEDQLHQIERLCKKLEDPNIEAYEALRNTQEWFVRYQNQYVVFLNGELIDSDTNKTKLLERLQKNHPAQLCFVKLIQQDDMIIDLPYFEIIDHEMIDPPYSDII